MAVATEHAETARMIAASLTDAALAHRLAMIARHPRDFHEVERVAHLMEASRRLTTTAPTPRPTDRITAALVAEFGAGTHLSDVELYRIEETVYDAIRDHHENDDAARLHAEKVAARWESRTLPA